MAVMATAKTVGFACLAALMRTCVADASMSGADHDAATAAALLQGDAECAAEDDQCALSLRQLRGQLEASDDDGLRPEMVDQSDVEQEDDILGEQLQALEDAAMFTEVESTEEEDGEEFSGEVNLAETEAEESQAVPMIPYPKKYCTHCGEMAFCHRARNPGCGGYAMGGVASFNNRVKSHSCKIGPVLTIPRSFIRDINELRKMPGSFETLREMLVSGFSLYERKGNIGPVMQCIHKAESVSVRWLHLHTFCLHGHVDNMPSRAAYCAEMNSIVDATAIAAKWTR
eukprot:gb/GFBE01044270.1/.p1 GENE.gb/GFBE01044270.1/~~gb/GFBE01044270.1/.p1  ORF type:complete len:286 (+),score=81.17 gb/GFBE01044270.1/:1-858(+)